MPGLAGIRVAVITVSDRRAAGDLPDTAGPLLVAAFADEGADVTHEIVPDGVDSVVQAIEAAEQSGNAVVITTGGTGVSPRDFTPEATSQVIVQELPGISAMLRREGSKATPMASLSRGLAGVTAPPHRTIVINLPGSVGGARDGAATVIPLLGHLVGQVRGEDHA